MSSPTPAVSTVSYKVFSTFPFTSATTLTQWFDEMSTDVFNDVGSGKLCLQNDDTQLALCTRGKVIQKLVDSTVAFSWIIDHTVRKSLDPGEEAQHYTTLSGAGIGQYLDRAAVKPTLGYDKTPWGQSRTFSFATPGFSVSSWGSATVLVASQSTQSTYWTGLPSGMPGDPPWIGPSSGTDSAAPQGTYYLVKDFTVAADTVVVFFMAADNAALPFIDGYALPVIDASQDTTAGYRNAKQASVFLTAGTHRFAARVINTTFGGADPGFGVGPTLTGNPTGFMCVGYTADAAGRLGTQVLVTSSSWKILEYPSNPPGFTIGGVLDALLTEAQTDGLLTGLTWDFSATTDTAGRAWETLESVTVNVGDDYLSVLRAFAGAYLDWAMAPDALTLHAWKFRTRGSTQSVAYTAGSNLTGLTHDAQDVGTDALIVTWQGGIFRYPSSGGTRLAPLDTNARTKSEATTQAQQQLVILGGTRTQFAADIENIGTTDQPYTAYTVGDTVSVPDEDGNASAQKVIQIVGRADREGNPIWSPSFRDIHLDVTARLALTAKRMSSGTLGGNSTIAAPAGEPPPFGSQIESSEVTFHVTDAVTVLTTPKKRPSKSGNLYQVALTLTTAGSSTTTVHCYAGGVDVGSGSLTSGQTFAVFNINPIAWVEGNKTDIWFDITAAGTGAVDLLCEPRFL